MSDDGMHPASHAEPSARHQPSLDEPIAFDQVLDGASLSWSVSEVDTRRVPGTRGARCLLFTRDGVIRRVWDYPADWRSLDAAGLATLCGKR